jgi:hypothetical protein
LPLMVGRAPSAEVMDDEDVLDATPVTDPHADAK